MEGSSVPSAVQEGIFKISYSRGGGSSAIGAVSSAIGAGSSVAGSSVAGSSAIDVGSSAIGAGTRHIFIDNSNVFIGASNAFPKGESHTVCTNVPALVMLLGLGGFVMTRFVAGSQSSGKLHPVWDEYKKRGYTTSVHSRSQDSKTGTSCETGVDAILHAAILQLVVDKKNLSPGTHTIVLATGDGNAYNGLSSFPRVVKAAADAGFLVEIWSWKASCATRTFTEVAEKFGHGVITINYLDPHRDLICFVKKDENTTLGAATHTTVSLDTMTDTRVLSSAEISGTLSTMDAPVRVAGGFTISFTRKPGET